MDAQEKYDLLEELKEFLKGLKKFKRNLEHKDDISLLKKNIVNKLREELVCKAGALKSVVIELTGKEHIQRFGMVYNIWDVGLSGHRVSNICDVALDYCIDAVNEAIGKLKTITLVESEPSDTIQVKVPEDYGGKEASKELELILEGTPDMLLASINNVVKNLNSQGYKYGFRRTSGRPDYTSWDKTYFASYAVSQGTEGNIGTISFQLMPNERTLLKTSPPQELNSSFKYFLDALFAEFEQLGYIKKEKTAIVEGLPPEVLSAKANWKDIEREFGITKMSLGRKINFVSDNFRRNIIFRDVEQAFILASSGFSKPAVILAGGVIEELLRLYLEFKGFKPNKKDFDGYIKTCEQNGLLKAGISRLSDSVRHFRNLVHLSKEETKRHTISKSAAKGAVASIFTIANDFEVADQHLDSLRAKKEEYKKSILINGKKLKITRFDHSQGLNIDNLQSVLDLHFPNKPKVDLQNLLDELLANNVTIEEIEDGYYKVKNIFPQIEAELSEGLKVNRLNQTEVVRFVLDLTHDAYWSYHEVLMPDFVAEKIRKWRALLSMNRIEPK